MHEQVAGHEGGQAYHEGKAVRWQKLGQGRGTCRHGKDYSPAGYPPAQACRVPSCTGLQGTLLHSPAGYPPAQACRVPSCTGLQGTLLHRPALLQPTGCLPAGVSCMCLRLQPRAAQGQESQAALEEEASRQQTRCMEEAHNID